MLYVQGQKLKRQKGFEENQNEGTGGERGGSVSREGSRSDSSKPDTRTSSATVTMPTSQKVGDEGGGGGEGVIHGRSILGLAQPQGNRAFLTCLPDEPLEPRRQRRLRSDRQFFSNHSNTVKLQEHIVRVVKSGTCALQERTRALQSKHNFPFIPTTTSQSAARLFRRP